LVPITVI
jgi:hypothetical protein